MEIIHIPARFSKPMPDDPRDPIVLDPYPTPSERERAKADMLCQRADLLEKLPEPQQQTALRVMDHPSYWELQADESRLVQTIADDAATLLYARTLDQCSREVQVVLRFNAAIFLRSQFRAWLGYASEQAIQAVHQQLEDEIGPALPPDVRPKLRGLAARLAPLAVAVARDALGSNGITPGAYLRCHAGAVREQAERQAEPRRMQP